MFSQFFKEPLFTEAATDREMNAVDSEYKKNLSEDSRRLFQIEKSEIVRKGSILNRFSTGGLETLKIPTIREDLLSFHDKHYSSNIMSLVMVGRHSLEDLEKLAVENFSEVPNKNMKLADFSREEVYDDQSMGHIFKIVPNKNIKRLKILWNLPPSNLIFKEKPNGFISHLIGHEGPNSLLSQLIKEGLSTALSSGASDRLQESIDQMRIDITLTEKGEIEWKRVLELLYMYINKIKSEGIKQYIFDEKKKMNEYDFDNITKSTALNYASKLSSRLSTFLGGDDDVKDILWRPYDMQILNPEEIMKRLNLMTPERAITMFVSKIVEKQE